MINRRKISVAEAVVCLVESIMHPDKELLLEAYANCREQGYCLWNLEARKKVSFSENRNSDSIVVYSGKMELFSMQGNIPSEEAYERKLFFEYNEHYKAAEWIVAYLEVKEA